MPESRRLCWLHRIGYAATVILAVEIIGIGAVATVSWVHSRQIAAAQREETRTHEGPLVLNRGDVIDAYVHLLTASLPARKALGPDAVRFVAMPSFGKQWFAILLQMEGNRAHGLLVTFSRSADRELAASKPRAFAMPIAAYKATMVRLDRLADGWPGEDDFWSDGTPIAFERVRGARVTSGVGNGSHYDQISLALRDGLALHLPELGGLDNQWTKAEP